MDAEGESTPRGNLQPDFSRCALNIQTASAVERDLAAVGLVVDVNITVKVVRRRIDGIEHAESTYRDSLVRNPKPGILHVQIGS